MGLVCKKMGLHGSFQYGSQYIVFGFLMYHLRLKNESEVSEIINNKMNLYRSNSYQESNSLPDMFQFLPSRASILYRKIGGLDFKNGKSKI